MGVWSAHHCLMGIQERVPLARNPCLLFSLPSPLAPWDVKACSHRIWRHHNPRMLVLKDPRRIESSLLRLLRRKRQLPRDLDLSSRELGQVFSPH